MRMCVWGGGFYLEYEAEKNEKCRFKNKKINLILMIEFPLRLMCKHILKIVPLKSPGGKKEVFSVLML